MNPETLAGRVTRHTAIGVPAVLSFLGLQLAYGRLSPVLAAWGDGAAAPYGLFAERVLYAALFCGVGWFWFARVLPWFFLLRPGVVAPEQKGSWLMGTAPGRGLAFGLFGGCLLFGLMLAFDAYIRSPGSPALSPDRLQMRSALERFDGLILYLPLSALITPLLEEIFYRGILIGFLRGQGLRPWFALLLPALCFAAAHPPATFPLLLGIGLVLGVLFWRYGLASAVVAHSTYNAGILLYTFLATPASPG